MADIVGFATLLAALMLEKLKQYIALALLPFSVFFHDVRITSESMSHNIRDWYDSQVTLGNYSTAAVATASNFAHQYRHVQNIPQRVILDWFRRVNIMRFCCEAYLAMDKATEIFKTWAANCCWIPAYWVVVYLRTVKALGNGLRAKEAFIKNNAGPLLIASAGGCRNNTLLVWNRCVELRKVMMHHYRSIDPQIIAAVAFCTLAAVLIYSRHRIWNACRRSRQQRKILLELARQFASPLSQLQNMQLEMILRKPMVGSYVYDDNTSKQSPRDASFSSTLQPHKPHQPPTFSTLPAALRTHILSLALASASSFAWHPTTRSLRLSTPNITFHRAWRLARSLGHVLPGNSILIDACAHPLPAGATPSASLFVPRPPSGREQLLDLLAIMSLPAVARKLWLERVAESMRAGERWVVVVREAWGRVWSFDVGLMVACFRAEAFVKAFPVMVVEYRIVMGGGEKARVAELVRQMAEAVGLGYKDKRFRVLVEGLEGWEGEVVGEEFEGRSVVELVEEVVVEMNGVD